jgi:transposase
VRILFWDTNGFCILGKRLEQGRFRVPAVSEGQACVSLAPRQLAELLALVETARRLGYEQDIVFREQPLR